MRVQFINQWIEWLKPKVFNWQGFDVFNLSFENDKIGKDKSLTFIILGIGFYISYISKENQKKWEEIAREAIKKEKM